MNIIRFGCTGNMQKIIQSQTHSKFQDTQRDYYLNQKKALEINPRHPLIKELLRRVEDNPADASAKESGQVHPRRGREAEDVGLCKTLKPT